MNTMESLRTSFKKHVWDVISPRWWLILLIALILTMFSDLLAHPAEQTSITPICDAIQLMLFLILTQIIFIMTTHNVYFFDAPEQNLDTPEQKKEVSFKFMTAACGVLAFMAMIFIWIMFSEYMFKLVGGWLGTVSKKAATLSSIGYGMGGVLAVIGAIAINRRADADVKNNKLTEKGHINERFQHATVNLGHDKTNVRIASFYQFYYLAAKKMKTLEKTKQFRQSIFEILCSHLRVLSYKLPHPSRKEPEEKCSQSNTASKNNMKNDHENIAEECRTLFDILFKTKFKSNEAHSLINPNDKFEADLQNIRLVGINFSHAKLSYANLLGAELQGEKLSRDKSDHEKIPNKEFKYANFTETDLSHANLLDAILPHALFIRTNLSRAVLDDADLSGAKFRNVIFSHTTFKGTNLSNSRLSFANLPGANFFLANLSNARLVNANLSGARLWLANFSEADLSEANLSKADFSQADLSKADLSKAYLSEADFLRADLSGADFFRADIKKAIFKEAKLDNANFKNVRNISEADFREATIDKKPIPQKYFIENFPNNKGEYYTDHNPPPDKE